MASRPLAQITVAGFLARLGVQFLERKEAAVIFVSLAREPLVGSL